MHKGRLEAFSDGVIAIIITVMVLELKTPSGPSFSDLLAGGSKFLSYFLSFVFIGIYWNNHHHLFQAAQRVNGKVLWLNLHLLFWLSLVPFATAWMGEDFHQPVPIALYGAILMFAGAAYFLLAHELLCVHGKHSTLATALGEDFKGKISVLIYAVAIPTAFVLPIVSLLFYIAVGMMWLVPDQRIERVLK